MVKVLQHEARAAHSGPGDVHPESAPLPLLLPDELLELLELLPLELELLELPELLPLELELLELPLLLPLELPLLLPLLEPEDDEALPPPSSPLGNPPVLLLDEHAAKTNAPPSTLTTSRTFITASLEGRSMDELIQRGNPSNFPPGEVSPTWRRAPGTARR